MILNEQCHIRNMFYNEEIDTFPTLLYTIGLIKMAALCRGTYVFVG